MTIKTTLAATSGHFDVSDNGAASPAPQSEKSIRVFRVRGGDVSSFRTPQTDDPNGTSVESQIRLALRAATRDAFLELSRKYPEHVVRFSDDEGNSLLFIASRLKNSSDALTVSNRLLELGIPADGPPNHLGRTPLMEMVRLRPVFHYGVACLFKENVNSTDSMGRTALIYAVQGAGMFGRRSGNASIVKSLLSLGAYPHIADNDGKTALDYALDANHERINDQVVKVLSSARQ
jgi:ankyrin repeat protein